MIPGGDSNWAPPKCETATSSINQHSWYMWYLRFSQQWLRWWLSSGCNAVLTGNEFTNAAEILPASIIRLGQCFLKFGGIQQVVRPNTSLEPNLHFHRKLKVTAVSRTIDMWDERNARISKLRNSSQSGHFYDKVSRKIRLQFTHRICRWNISLHAYIFTQ